MNFIFNIISFIVVFLIVYIFCYFFAGRIKDDSKKRENGKRKVHFKLMPVGIFLIKRYDLDENKINLKSFNRGICFCEAFIIAFVSTVIGLMPVNFGFKFALAFVLVFLLIYAILEIYGRILKKKWGKERK